MRKWRRGCGGIFYQTAKEVASQVHRILPWGKGWQKAWRNLIIQFNLPDELSACCGCHVQFFNRVIYVANAITLEMAFYVCFRRRNEEENSSFVCTELCGSGT